MFAIQFTRFDYRARFVGSHWSTHQFKTLKEAQAYLAASGYVADNDKARCHHFRGHANTTAHIFTDREVKAVQTYAPLSVVGCAEVHTVI